MKLLPILLAAAAYAQQFTPEKEAALGQQMVDMALKGSRVIEDQAIKTWVDQTGSRLAAHVQTPFRFHFVVIAGNTGSPTNEPRSYPGGYIVIPAQLFLASQNDAEFARMLAHAMAHVVNRDATRAAYMPQEGVVPLLAIFPSPSRTPTRQYEQEADASALRMTRDAGYDAAVQASDEFRAIQNRFRRRPPTLLRNSEVPH